MASKIGKSLMRRVRGSSRLRRLISGAALFYVRLVERTTRWTVEGVDNREIALRTEGPDLLAMWHGRFHLSLPDKPPPRATLAIVSANRDGDMVAGFLAGFDVDVVRGSSWDVRKSGQGKGAMSAVRDALRYLRKGALFVVTPDGPRGPRMRVQPGIAALSVMARAPVTPFAYSTRWGFVAPSWDRMFIPGLFSRGVKLWGDQIPVPETRDEAAIESHRRRIEEALIALTQRADHLMGRAPVDPAAPAP